MPPQDIDWLAILPTLLVAGTGILALIAEIILPKRDNGLIIGFSLAGLALASYFVFGQYGQPPAESFAGMLWRDDF
ncbi:MAG TPA: hypothetical protein VG820_09930, partial [Fimbriimonadaceae bacterium]|nr:hypothetical protein [Fimbriimonadaceae bacterium]